MTAAGTRGPGGAGDGGPPRRARWARGEDVPGHRVFVLSWLGTLVFAVAASGDQAGVRAFEQPATVTSLALFGVGCVVWLVAFVRAVLRSSREQIALGGLLLLEGSAPRRARAHLLGSLAVSVVVAGATAAEAPFGVMQPVFPLSLLTWWAARHGRFPARPATAGARPRR